MRRWDLVSVVLNGVIGAGLFGLPSKVFGLAGSYSLLAFGICALCVAIIVLNFCEVASHYSGSGGPYLYAREVKRHQADDRSAQAFAEVWPPEAARRHRIGAGHRLL